MRTEDWKYVTRRSPDGPTGLYDLKDHPHERLNTFGQSEYASIQAVLAQKLDEFFSKYADPQYDIWKGAE